MNSKELRHESVFLKACRGEKTSYTPIWLMRQAGRYMQEYRSVRQNVAFLDLCKNKDLCAEVAVTAQERIGADAAILFSDILPIVECLGMKLEYGGETSPSIRRDFELTTSAIDRLPEIVPQDSLSYVFDAVRTTRKCLQQHIPLIGFSGAPFTLASYIIEGSGSRNFVKTKSLMYTDPGAWHALLEKISRGLIKYLQGQIDSGADALQIFDSWVGCLSPADYETFVAPHSRSIIQALSGQVPIIHFGTGTATFLDKMKAAGGDVLGADFRIPLDEAWQKIGTETPIQGNLDPVVLLAPREELLKRAKKVLDEAGGRAGHIFNLGHGILPQTPVDNVIALIDFVHEQSQK